MQNVRSRSRNYAAGYTLIEMMVVMIILLVVMALVAPIIGGARNAARKTTTQQILSNITQACQQFELNERRLPGYFSQVDMAAPGSRGLSETNNIMLDLAGGIVESADPGNPPGDAIQIGPTTQTTAYLRLSMIGAPTQSKGVVNKGYYMPDPKYFVPAESNARKVTSYANHLLVPDLIDAFGQPILAWRQDLDPGTGPFTQMTSNTRASFYWQSNACFINATSLGRKEQDQTLWESGENGSAIGRGVRSEDNILYSMHGLLGHPSFPAPNRDATGQEVPAKARGRLIFHSAGNDGVYLNRRDRGGIIAASNGNANHTKDVVDFRAGIDPMDNFDDLLSVAGN